MTLAVHLTPSLSEISDDNGVGRVVHALHTHLPAHGIELVSDPAEADVTACHIEGQGRQIDVLHLHGLYFSDIPHEPYQAWHREANTRIIATARAARAITVPSAWVAMPFLRDMRITPVVIPHGIDLDAWYPVGDPKGYALWNKNRASDVCDPAPAVELARRGIPVISTFTTANGARPEGLFVIGPQAHGAMRRFIEHAGVYLATTLETFGIGTLEALAAGVPVIGYHWGATPDLVRDGIEGRLVESGDLDALAAAFYEVSADPSYRRRARARAEAYPWHAAIAQYAALYRRVADEKARERHRVCVVITSYNYGQYLAGAVASVVDQLRPDDEVIVVDDGSTDDTAAVCAALPDGVQVLHQANQGVAAARNNGIAATDCDYVICLDADDQLAPGYVQVCRDALASDRALGLAYTGLGLLDAQGRVSPSAFPPDFDWEHQSRPGMPPNTCVPTAAMFRRQMWERAGGYQQIHAPGEDAEFYTRGLSVGFTARKVAAEPWIWYRDHGAGAHKTRPYKPIDGYHPWMRDRLFPMGAPTAAAPPVRSYVRPAISVIIPCGPSHARYLPSALNSLLMQTFRQWEVLIIDDTGGDDLRTLLRPYPFVRLITLPHAVDKPAILGPGAARNAGIDAARAPWVLFLDADDWLADPDALTALAATAYAHGRYAYSDWLGMASDGTIEAHQAPEYSATAWLQQGQHAVTALLPITWVRDVGGFDPDLAGWEDWDFYIKLALHGHCGVRVPRPLLGYRYFSGTIREQSLSRKDALLPELQRRYEGQIPMGCGSCAAQAAAMRRLHEEITGDVLGASMGMDVGEGQALMRYTGTSAGLQRVNSRHKQVNGRPVKYEYGGANRLLAVWQEDVSFLEGLGTFERVGPSAPAPTPPPAIVAPIAPSPVASPPAAPTAPDADADAPPVADVSAIAAAFESRRGEVEQRNEAKVQSSSPRRGTRKGR